MSDPRAQRPSRPVGTSPRPRYRRLAAAGSAFAVTLVTLLGAAGVLPQGGSAAAASGGPGAGTPGSAPAASLANLTLPDAVRSVSPPAPVQLPEAATAAALPAETGAGKRVVFDMSDQRVWLVDPDAEGRDVVQRTYLVSGSLTDNLDPGTYEVFSRSRHAIGIDDSGTMEYFVRFTRGDNAAIGFHSIPTKDGRALQRIDQLGTPTSHGCIRQAKPDAVRLWAFAPVGTKVVVTA